MEFKEVTLSGFGYAPGGYTCKCHTCEKQFIGDKLARTCKSCAIEMMANSRMCVDCDEVDVVNRLRCDKCQVKETERGELEYIRRESQLGLDCVREEDMRSLLIILEGRIRKLEDKINET